MGWVVLKRGGMNSTGRPMIEIDGATSRMVVIRAYRLFDENQCKSLLKNSLRQEWRRKKSLSMAQDPLQRCRELHFLEADVAGDVVDVDHAAQRHVRVRMEDDRSIALDAGDLS